MRLQVSPSCSSSVSQSQSEAISSSGQLDDDQFDADESPDGEDNSLDTVPEIDWAPEEQDIIDEAFQQTSHVDLSNSRSASQRSQDVTTNSNNLKISTSTDSTMSTEAVTSPAADHSSPAKEVNGHVPTG